MKTQTTNPLLGLCVFRSSVALKSLALTLAFLSPSFSSSSAELRVGVAATDITPPLGIPMAGYYHERGADGVNVPLFSKALPAQRQVQGGARKAISYQFNVPINTSNGTIPKDSHAQLVRLGRHLQN